MRQGRLRHAASIVAATLVAGCAGAPPVSTPGPTTSRPSAASTPGAGATSTPARPPLAADLTGGTTVRLGAVGHWAIDSGRAFVATDDNTVIATDLATGATAWQAKFSMGEPWDAQPTLALSADGRTVVAVRTVQAEGAARLGLLVLDAASGTVTTERLMADPQRTWRVDLPPRVLAADSNTVVLADDPESGRQTAVVTLADGSVAWRVDDQAVAANSDLVVTRGGGRSRTDGVSLWKAETPIGAPLAQTPDALVVAIDRAAVWLELTTGRELARSDRLAEAEPACAPAGDTLLCLGSGVTGYALSDGTRLWSSADPADSVFAVLGWAYLGKGGAHGDVLDARTGRVLNAGVDLPPVRYSDRTGVLLGADDGYRWVPFVR